MEDIVFDKVESLQRCIKRAREEYAEAGANFATDYTRQDAAVLNVIRACELSIDLAAHLVRRRKLGVPSNNRESFELLRDAQLIPATLCDDLSRMVGFPNIVVHSYQSLEIEKVIEVIHKRLDDLLRFRDVALDLD
jgi:uncharacterized protein YutE (UPF0331/DUF86 family)